jgi:hypothetical protein
MINSLMPIDLNGQWYDGIIAKEQHYRLTRLFSQIQFTKFHERINFNNGKLFFALEAHFRKTNALMLSIVVFSKSRQIPEGLSLY